jgi:hypothetical protein
VRRVRASAGLSDGIIPLKLAFFQPLPLVDHHSRGRKSGHAGQFDDLALWASKQSVRDAERRADAPRHSFGLRQELSAFSKRNAVGGWCSGDLLLDLALREDSECDDVDAINLDLLLGRRFCDLQWLCTGGR